MVVQGFRAAPSAGNVNRRPTRSYDSTSARQVYVTSHDVDDYSINEVYHDGRAGASGERSAEEWAPLPGYLSRDWDDQVREFVTSNTERAEVTSARNREASPIYWFGWEEASNIPFSQHRQTQRLAQATRQANRNHSQRGNMGPGAEIVFEDVE